MALRWPERLHVRIFAPIVIGTAVLGAITIGATLLTVTRAYQARLADQLASQERLTERILHEIEEHLMLYGAAAGRWEKHAYGVPDPAALLSLDSDALHALGHDGMTIRFSPGASPEDPDYRLMRDGHRGKTATGLVTRQTPEGKAHFIEAVALIERGGRPVGFMVVDLPLADALLADLGGAPGADVTLLLDGEAVASTVGEEHVRDAIVREATTPAILDAVIGRGRQVTMDLRATPTPQRALFSPFVRKAENIGMLVHSISLQPLVDARWRILSQGIPAIGVAVLLIVVISNLFIGRVTRPLRQLADATAAVASGRLDVPLVIEKPAGEVEILKEGFSRMLTELKTWRGQAAEWNKGLEARVAERTRQLEEAHAELIQAGKLAVIGELASGLAHEVRNPLAVIRMSAQYLMKKITAGEKTERHLEMIHEEINRIDRLIADLLGFARPTDPVLRSTELGRLLEDALAFAAPEISTRGIRTTVSVAPALPPILADPDQIRQVLLNLILNACQAMPDGGDLVVSATAVNNGRTQGAQVRIEIADTGPGIAPGDLERIFTPFFTTKASGTGLGLSISQRIVRSHGGNIAAGNLPGQGAAFVITLPLGMGA